MRAGERCFRSVDYRSSGRFIHRGRAARVRPHSVVSSKWKHRLPELFNHVMRSDGLTGPDRLSDHGQSLHMSFGLPRPHVNVLRRSHGLIGYSAYIDSR